ncbi:transposable element Tc1 transposase [Trichonephila clavipes]|nr:transposable element Tc1 transposase [Trichonephila clavipes]
MPHRRIPAHYEPLSVFERGRIIRLKEANWANRRKPRRRGRNRYAACHLRLHTVQSDYSGARLDQQDNVRPHTACVAMNCLTACQTLPCPSRSPDFSLFKHVLDMMGRRLHIPENADDLAR